MNEAIISKLDTKSDECGDPWQWVQTEQQKKTTWVLRQVVRSCGDYEILYFLAMSVAPLAVIIATEIMAA